MQPVAYKTVKAIPSLLIGQPVDDFRYRFDNTFLVHYTAQHGWHKVTGAQTVFHDAQQNGDDFPHESLVGMARQPIRVCRRTSSFSA